MYDLILGFKFAFAYFSILPVKFGKDDNLSSSKVLGSMLLFFPLVGTLLATISVGVFLLLEPLGWYGAIFASVLYMILYGFLHTEAILDVADALYASHSGKDAYSIIKDPTVGAMGVVWSVGVVILKLSGATFLLMHHLFSLFIFIALLSRFGLLLLFYTQKFRSNFLTQLKESFTWEFLKVALISYSLIALYLLGVFSLFFALLAFGIAFLIAKYLEAKLGFMNGDLLGATLEGSEVLLLLFGALLWH